MVDGIGPGDRDAEGLEQGDELIQLLLGRPDHGSRISQSCGKPLYPGGPRRYVAGDYPVPRGSRGAVETADENFLQRVPFVVRTDG
ncbi:hypothetical protein GCM10010253_37410 [Streptomyces badius]|uniref:Uncharacterized protein n=1 Tax=Streptomyces badius TaxID=1941 RepID=A0ABQ2T9B8_STRBA|nr:hypothetical protein GCM10010253_37410 [Streptomyces badius]